MDTTVIVFWLLFFGIVALIVLFVRKKIKQFKAWKERREHEKELKKALDEISSFTPRIVVSHEVTGGEPEKKRISTMTMPSFEKRLPKDYVAFDLETTGLDSDIDRIIEIGAVKVIDGKPVQYYSTFVDPVWPIPEEATKVNNITDEMVRGAPRIGAALPDFVAFIGDISILAAHNARFDAGFLEHAAKAQSIEINYKYLDSLAVSRKYFPELKNYKLGTVAKHLKYNIENAHRALDDAKAVHEIIRAAEDQIIRKKEVQQ